MKEYDLLFNQLLKKSLLEIEEHQNEVKQLTKIVNLCCDRLDIKNRKTEILLEMIKWNSLNGLEKRK